MEQREALRRALDCAIAVKVQPNPVSHHVRHNGGVRWAGPSKAYSQEKYLAVTGPDAFHISISARGPGHRDA
jgi:hypothetical protein